MMAELSALGRSVAGGGYQTDGDPVLLSNRMDVLVVRLGEVVVKAHPLDTDRDRLSAQVRMAADPLLRAVLLPPLAAGGADADAPPALLHRVRGRWATVWPAGEPVSPDDPDAAPWAEAGRLLACLHTVPASAVGRSAGLAGLPAADAPRRVTRAIARLQAVPGGPGRSEVIRAFASLPLWGQGPPPGRAAESGPGRRDGLLVHGDWHLGQLVRWPASRADGRGWRLIDVDDLGCGDPAWDLARSAAWYAVGLVSAEDWWRFLSAYRSAGGPAFPPASDPWSALDLPAKALTVQMAALSVVAAYREDRQLDDIETSLVDACRRISLVAAEGRFETRPNL
jgi:aminoglycoside phosphotransferase (APT) family kinase protein